MPDQPSSTIFAHVPRSKPSALSSSRNLRSCEIGAFVVQNDFAVSLSMFCSSLRIIGIAVPLISSSDSKIGLFGLSGGVIGKAAERRILVSSAEAPYARVVQTPIEGVD